MAETTKGQGSLRVYYFHITPPSARNSKYRVKEVHEENARAFDGYEEALDEAKRRVKEVEAGHIIIHDEYGRFKFYEE
jgi:hypothetical protein